MTKREHVRQWWGCADSTLPVCEIDLRPGGLWRYLMHMPDGSDHPFKGVYREIARPERLVYTECYDVPSVGSPEWLTTVTFEGYNGKTKVTSTCLHSSKEARDGHLNSGMEAGAAQTFRKLAEYVASLAAIRV